MQSLIKIKLIALLWVLTITKSIGQLTNTIQVGKTGFFFSNKETSLNELISIHYSQDIGKQKLFYRFGIDSYLKKFSGMEIGGLGKRNFLSLQGIAGLNILKDDSRAKNILRIGIGPSFRLGGESIVRRDANNQILLEHNEYQDPGLNFSTEYLFFPLKKIGVGAELNYQHYFKLTRSHPAIRFQICYRFSNPKYIER